MKKLFLLLVISLGLIGSVNAERLSEDEWFFHQLYHDVDLCAFSPAGISPASTCLYEAELQNLYDLGTFVEAQVLDSIISFEYDGSKYELPICIGEVTPEGPEANNCKKSSIQPTSDTIIKAHVFDIFSNLEPWVSFTETPIPLYKILSCCEKNALAEEVIDSIESLGFVKRGKNCFYKKFSTYKIGDIDNHITQYEKELGTQGRCEAKTENLIEKAWGFKGGNYQNSWLEFEFEYRIFLIDFKKNKISTTWYENGQIMTEEKYKDDKLDGKSTAWYENGQKWVEVNYKDGKKDGKGTEWYENGQIISEAIYKDGECVSGDC